MVEGLKNMDEDKQAIPSGGTSFPATPIDCQIFHRTDLNRQFFWSDSLGAWVELTAIFGCAYQKASDEGEDTTTSSSYQEKLKLTTPSLVAGDYYIGYSYEHANSGKDKCTMTQVELDDATLLHESCKPKVATDDDYVGCSGFVIQTLTTAVHTIDIDFKAVSDTAKIRRARLVIWRVA